MRIGTRLLVALLPSIGVVMLGYGLWALTQRQATVVSEARRETEAYARALALAVDYAGRSLPPAELKEILDEVSREPSVYGVSVYDTAGQPTLVAGALQEFAPAAPEHVRAVLAGGGSVRAEREVEGERVYTVLHPLRDARGLVAGVVEVAQPLGFVEEEVTRVGTRFLLNTVTLLLTVALLTLFMVRRVVSLPLQRFVEATRAVGRGELQHRLGTTGSGELAALGAEFDRMAAGLDAARTQLLRETENRVALERRLRESENMATIGKLAAGLAHEIAAPLNVISGRAELVLRREELDPEPRRSLRIIVDQIGRITTIVRNLLDFGRRRAARRLPLDLGDVIAGALGFLDAEFVGAGITVEREGTAPARAVGDPDHLHQVLVNLLLNAVQALAEADGERRITVRLARDAAVLSVEVADTGPGIPDDRRARVFEPFFTTRQAGTGLGLVVSRSIVEEHGGTLDAVPPPGGRGAVFRMTLPLPPEAETADG